MPRREALRPKGVFEQLQRNAALGRDHHVDGVDVEDRVHSRAVEHDRILDDRLESALGRGAAGAGHDVDEVLVREREDRRHVGGGPRVGDRGGDRTVEDAVHGCVLLEAVDARLAQRLRLGLDLVGAEDLLQSGDDLLT